METLLAIIFIVFGVLQIILFFKLWGMTDDIKEIKNKYLKDTSRKPETNTNFIEPSSTNTESQQGESSDKMSPTSVYSGIFLVMILVLAVILVLCYK